MLKKRLIYLVVALAAIAVVPSASQAFTLVDFQSATEALTAVDATLDPPPNDPNRDFAVGGFQGSIENNNWGVSGHSGPLGESPQGHVSETIPGAGAGTFQARWRVVCVAVVGNFAALGLVPTAAASNDQPDSFVLSLFDGDPAGLDDSFGVVPISPLSCEEGLGFADFAIEHGNILVNDALPLP